VESGLFSFPSPFFPLLRDPTPPHILTWVDNFCMVEREGFPFRDLVPTRASQAREALSLPFCWPSPAHLPLDSAKPGPGVAVGARHIKGGWGIEGGEEEWRALP